MQDIEKELLSLKAIEDTLRSIFEKEGFDIGPPELIDTGIMLSVDEKLYKANLGTKEHPFWIAGSKDGVQKEIEWFQRKLLTEIAKWTPR
jgi:hypothetical protein